MKNVAMTELMRGKFDAVLREVQVQGLTFVITRYGKPVALISPLPVNERPLTDPTAGIASPD